MSLSPRDRLRRVAAVLLAAAGPAGTAQGGVPPPQITVVGDSVIVSGLATGRATIRVTRPDARTKAPVVIGEFSGAVSDSLPFSVNTTVSDPLYIATSDCWQAGALHLAGGVGLTPDIRPGDTVAVVGGPSLKVVRGSGSGTPRGPIAGCAPTSVFAENAVTGTPSSIANAKLVVSGVAQPLTTGVSVSVSDGRRSTAPVDVVPTAGRWQATIPAAEVERLAKGTLTVTAVFAVPDISTGAVAHIRGAARTVQKTVGPSLRQGEARRPPHATGRTPTAGSVRVYAMRKAAARGWTGAHWRALEAIVWPESRWDPCAVYPQRHSCAYAGAESCGLPQAQPCPRAWRGRLWHVRFAQVRWLLDYIAARYGDPQSALHFRQAHTWY
jgi:hypothetical protein